jgi:hypothetical protein
MEYVQVMAPQQFHQHIPQQQQQLLPLPPGHMLDHQLTPLQQQYTVPPVSLAVTQYQLVQPQPEQLQLSGDLMQQPQEALLQPPQQQQQQQYVLPLPLVPQSLGASNAAPVASPSSVASVGSGGGGLLVLDTSAQTSGIYGPLYLN